MIRCTSSSFVAGTVDPVRRDRVQLLRKYAAIKIVTMTDPYSRVGMTAGASWRRSDKTMNEFYWKQKVAADKVLNKVKADAGKIGIDAALVHVSEARLAEAILHMAGTQGAHLIVIGYHDRRGANRLLLGSQAAELLAHAAIPVLVVK